MFAEFQGGQGNKRRASSITETYSVVFLTCAYVVVCAGSWTSGLTSGAWTYLLMLWYLPTCWESSTTQSGKTSWTVKSSSLMCRSESNNLLVAVRFFSLVIYIVSFPQSNHPSVHWLLHSYAHFCFSCCSFLMEPSLSQPVLSHDLQISFFSFSPLCSDTYSSERDWKFNLISPHLRL